MSHTKLRRHKDHDFIKSPLHHCIKTNTFAQRWANYGPPTLVGVATLAALKRQNIQAIIERVATQFLVWIDAFFVQVEGGGRFFGDHHFQSTKLGTCTLPPAKILSTGSRPTLEWPMRPSE